MVLGGLFRAWFDKDITKAYKDDTSKLLSISLLFLSLICVTYLECAEKVFSWKGGFENYFFLFLHMRKLL